ncbi:exodeoxyribonuclease isoform X2 [Euwallacea fornicatus]
MPPKRKASAKAEPIIESEELPMKKARRAPKVLKTVKENGESSPETSTKSNKTVTKKVEPEIQQLIDETSAPKKKGKKAKDDVGESSNANKKKNEVKPENEKKETPHKEKSGRAVKTTAAEPVVKKKEEPIISKVASKKAAKADKAKKPRIKIEEENSTKEVTTKSKAAPLLNTVESKWDTINFDCTKKSSQGKRYNLKITSWNVDGIRAWLKKGGFSILKHDKPDIFCLQESKCGTQKLPQEVVDIEGYKDYWCSSQKDGYAGVGVYSKIEPIDVVYGIDSQEHNNEGRCITLEYDSFYVVNVYVPNAGRGLVTLPKRLDWNKSFKNFITKLDQKKPVILCGDMNVAHNEIDLKNPKTNKKNAGFTQEERDGMTDFLENGFADTFRELYPDVTDAYTFWSYMSQARSKNIGWRLDYFIVSQRLMPKVCDSTIRNDVFGSDHCPISIFISV